MLDGPELFPAGGFWNCNASCAGAVDVSDDAQVAVELDAGTECPARSAAAQQAGQLDKAEILEVDDITVLWRLKCFGLGDGILSPVEVDAPEVGAFGGERDGGFFGLVNDLEFVFFRNSGIDFGAERIHGGKNEEVGSLDYSIPPEWIRQVRIGGGSERFGAVVGAGFESVDGAAVLVVAQGPQERDGDEGEGGGDAAAWTPSAGANFVVDQREEGRHDQSEQEAGEHDGLEDEDDVPGVPLFGEGPEGADAIVVGKIEEDVAESGEAGIEEKQSPARRKIWIFQLAAAKTPE